MIERIQQRQNVMGSRPPVVTSEVGKITSAQPGSEELYLDLLKKCLTRYVFPSDYRAIEPNKGTFQRAIFAPVKKLLASRQLELVRAVRFDPQARAEGRDNPFQSLAETMLGLPRLDHLQHCVTDVIRRGVPGDVIETGVWRGGATIFMRAVLKAYHETERIVWVADSFQGFPKSDDKGHFAEMASYCSGLVRMAVPLDEVKANFDRYGLLDDQVRFLVGWFRDTLPGAPINRLAVLRLDGVMYESTMDALSHLYPKLSVGGYLIIDDYANPQCKAAVDDFRAKFGIAEKMEDLDGDCVFWRRLR